MFMRIQDVGLAGNQQNVSKLGFGDHCSFVTYLIDNFGVADIPNLDAAPIQPASNISLLL